MLESLAIIGLLLSFGSPGSRDPRYQADLEREAQDLRNDGDLQDLSNALRRADRGHPEEVEPFLQELQIPRQTDRNERKHLKRALDAFLDEGLSTLVAGTDSGARARIAGMIGSELPHPSLVPLLRKIATSNDDPVVRAGAVYSLSLISYPEVVPDLIGHLRDGSADVRNVAWEQLRSLTGCGGELLADDEGLWARCNSWWQEHRIGYQYDRQRLFRHR